MFGSTVQIQLQLNCGRAGVTRKTPMWWCGNSAILPGMGCGRFVADPQAAIKSPGNFLRNVRRVPERGCRRTGEKGVSPDKNFCPQIPSAAACMPQVHPSEMGSQKLSSWRQLCVLARKNFLTQRRSPIQLVRAVFCYGGFGWAVDALPET